VDCQEGEGGLSRLSGWHRGLQRAGQLQGSKVVVGLLDRPGADLADLRKWFADSGDARATPRINDEIVAFLREHGVRTVAMAEGIIGCPHEEGIDYPDGGTCPHCPFWANRDRWGVAGG
jgi:hypothetical protein